MKIRFLLFLFILASSKSIAQQVVQYEPGFNFREGIYLTFDQFRENNPIPNENIVTKLNRNDPAFLEYLVENKSIEYTEPGDTTLRTVNTNDLWGFSRNNTIFIRVESDFNRIAVLGSISHFVAVITVFFNNMNNPFYNPYYGGGTMPTTREEMRQMMLDFQTGRTTDFSQENFTQLLMRDSKLYDEYSRLKKSQKRDMMFLYLRKYNERHPIFFPAK